ncbi:MAG TPA: DUF5060 domain-containing protein [Bacteroidales bacterium]|nr:DUF5060 domain-containing protein [Bacteroidales bacterium]
MKKRILLNVLFLATGILCFSNPVFLKISEPPASVALYDKFELTIDLKANYTNPFDFDQVNLVCMFRSPSGKQFTIDGFYYEDFSYECNPATFDEGLKDLGTHHWMVRFTPVEAGTWQYQLSCTDQDGKTTDPDTRSFTCTGSGQGKGFIRKANARYLKYDNGDFYFPININAGWSEATITAICSYHDWIDNFAAHGGNNMRIWANSYMGMSLEKHEKDNHYTPGDYSAYMKNGFRLDNILDYARSKGVNIQLVIDDHSIYNCRTQAFGYCYFQKENPYYCGNLNSSVYKYCASEGYDCFTLTKTQPYKTLIKWQTQRTRYMIARWGYASNLSAWELMNEFDLLENLKDNPDHIEIMKDYFNYIISVIKKYDVNNHLICISGGREMLDGNPDPNSRAGLQVQVFSLPGIDFICHHTYSDNSVANSSGFNEPKLPEYLGDLIPRTQAALKKPVVVDETLWGDRHYYPEGDPNGYLLHNLLWITAFSGSMGTARPWDWVPMLTRNPAPANKYYCPGYMDQFKTLADYMKGINLLDETYLPENTEQDRLPFHCYYLAGEKKLYGYIQNREYDWEQLYATHKTFLMAPGTQTPTAAITVPSTIPDNTSCTLLVKTPGTYRITFYSCGEGNREISSATYQAKSHGREYLLKVELPAISWDVAFKAELIP